VAAEDVKSTRSSKPKRKARTRRRPSRAVLVRRWLGVGALCLIGLLYYRPLKTYFGTHRTLVQRDAEVAGLRAERRALERKLADAATDSALVREARRLGYVKPTEKLFIVKGVEAWRRAQRTIRGHGR
jgi:cell division protein FtsB